MVFDARGPTRGVAESAAVSAVCHASRDAADATRRPVAAVFLAYVLACALVNLGIFIERYGAHRYGHAYGYDQHHWHHHHHHPWPHAEQMPHGRAYGQ